MKAVVVLVFLILSIQYLKADAPSYANSGTYYLEFDSLSQIVNLKESEDDSLCPKVEIIEGSEKGLQVHKTKQWYASLGLSNSFWFQDLGMWTNLGVAPNKSSYVLLMGEVANEAELENFEKRKLPFKVDDLKDWKIGDSIYWSSTGGVAFKLGAGVVPFHAGTTFIAKGSWGHYVEKTGDNTFYTSFRKNKIKGVTLSAGVSHLGASANRVKEQARGFSYEFDFSDPNAVEAYEDMHRGKVVTVQDEELSDTIQKISDDIWFKKGWERSVGIALPYIPLISFRSSVSNFEENEEMQFTWDASQKKTLQAYIKRKRSKIFGLHTNRTTQFETGELTMDEPDYENGGRIVKTEKINRYFYHYEADYGRHLKLRKNLKRLQKLTGLKDLLCAEVPKMKESLKYHQIRFSMVPNSKITEKSALVSLKAMTENFLSEYMNKGNDDLDLCGLYEDEEDQEIDFNACYRSQMRKVSKVFKKLTKTDPSDSFYGKLILSNPFVFKSHFEAGKNCGLKWSFEISGQKIKKIQRGEDFSMNESCLL